MTGSTKLEGVYEGGTGETGGPLRGILNRKKLLQANFNHYQPFQQVFHVVLSFNQISIISTIPTGVPRFVFVKLPGYLDDLRNTTEEIKGFFKEADMDGSGAGGLPCSL